MLSDYHALYVYQMLTLILVQTFSLYRVNTQNTHTKLQMPTITLSVARLPLAWIIRMIYVSYPSISMRIKTNSTFQWPVGHAILVQKMKMHIVQVTETEGKLFI